ncbi:hypothetical protein [Paenibacillus sp. Leaf72]|uniref:hypothetical protein n=1 Tax=Paenibacillus sp. Leaf72 TaxID=1736234 RepID=UPI000B09DAB1|nr:hypothetical protein [Paenibacillus sp. Leaf72]
MTKKHYDQAFKRQVVQMIQEEGKTAPQVAEELGLLYKANLTVLLVNQYHFNNLAKI